MSWCRRGNAWLLRIIAGTASLIGRAESARANWQFKRYFLTFIKNKKLTKLYQLFYKVLVRPIFSCPLGDV